MLKVIGTALSLVLSLMLGITTAYAHHSFSATFTRDEITVEGYVDEYKFTNPHVTVYFNVADENGEVTRWMTEGGAANLKRRDGWTRESLVKGDYIRVSGNSSRNGLPMVSMSTLEFVDPNSGFVTGEPGDGGVAEPVAYSTPLILADGRPNLSGAWTMAERRRGAGGGRGGPGRDRAPLPYNEAAEALQAVYDPVNDPQVQCEDPGLVRQAGFTPHPARIEQYDDHVVISYEEYGGVRTIYFDDRDLEADDLSNLGRSIAHYDDQKLIVESTHLLGNLTSPQGNALSDQTTTVETYSRNEDVDGQSSLSMEMVVTDPGHLTESWALSWQKYYNDNYEFIEVDCQKPLSY